MVPNPLAALGVPPAHVRAYEAMVELGQGRQALAAGLIAGLAAAGDEEATEALAEAAAGRWRPAIEVLARVARLDEADAPESVDLAVGDGRS